MSDAGDGRNSIFTEPQAGGLISFTWSKLWSWIFWITLLGCVINMVLAIPSLQRWKWGYFTIDWIPSLIILFLLWCINTTLRIGDLERLFAKDKKTEHKTQ